MADRTIPDYCFNARVNAACVAVGVNVSNLDIKSGDSLDYVIEKLGSQSIPQALSQDEINANLYCLGGSGNSICASMITVRNLTYSCTPNFSGGVNVNWDMTGVRDSLPPGFNILNSSVVINGSVANLPLVSTSSLKSALLVQINEFPITLDFKIRVTTTCGQVELNKSITLFNLADTGIKMAIMDLKDFTSQNIQNITTNQYHELVAREICSVKDRITVIEQGPNYGLEISTLNQKITSLENRLAQAEAIIATLT